MSQLDRGMSSRDFYEILSVCTKRSFCAQNHAQNTLIIYIHVHSKLIYFGNSLGNLRNYQGVSHASRHAYITVGRSAAAVKVLT